MYCRSADISFWWFHSIPLLCSDSQFYRIFQSKFCSPQLKFLCLIILVIQAIDQIIQEWFWFLFYPIPMYQLPSHFCLWTSPCVFYSHGILREKNGNREFGFPQQTSTVYPSREMWGTSRPMVAPPCQSRLPADRSREKKAERTKPPGWCRCSERSPERAAAARGVPTTIRGWTTPTGATSYSSPSSPPPASDWGYMWCNRVRQRPLISTVRRTDGSVKQQDNGSHKAILRLTVIIRDHKLPRKNYVNSVWWHFVNSADHCSKLLLLPQ